MPKVTSKRASKVEAKATARKRKATAKKVELTFKALKGLSTAELLAIRSSTPRANLQGHYAIRRALRAGGYFISQNR